MQGKLSGCSASGRCLSTVAASSSRDGQLIFTACLIHTHPPSFLIPFLPLSFSLPLSTTGHLLVWLCACRAGSGCSLISLTNTVELISWENRLALCWGPLQLCSAEIHLCAPCVHGASIMQAVTWQSVTGLYLGRSSLRSWCEFQDGILRI